MKKYIDAFVLSKINKPLKFYKLNFPILGFGQVLIKILYSGVCRSQLMEKKGLRGKDKWLPHLLGHEASGEVISIGKGVTKVKKKDKVILTWIKSKGIDANNPIYRSIKKKKISSGKVTTFSNYAVVSENRIIKKPKLLSLKYAPLFGCAIPTGSGIVLKQIKPKKTEIVVVIGLGGVGLSSVMALKALKVKKIIAIDINKKKLILAKKLGANNTFNINQKNKKKKISELKKINADYCIDSSGTLFGIELGFLLIKNKGKLIFASHPKKNSLIKIDPYDLIQGKKIEGSWGGEINPDKDIKKIFDLFLKNKIRYDLIAKKIYPLKKINEALKDLELGKVFRPIIKMSH